MDNTTNMQQQQAQQAGQKSGKGMQLAVVILGVIVLAGIFENVIFAMNGTFSASNNTTVDTAKEETEEKKQETQDPTAANKICDVSYFTDDYIYVPEWGIKIKKGDGMDSFMYAIDTVHTNPSLKLTAAYNENGGHIQYAPEFLQAVDRGSYLGILTRVAKDSPSGDYYKALTPVYSDDQADYYYTHAQALYSSDPTDINYEKAAAEAVKKMFENGVSAL